MSRGAARSFIALGVVAAGALLVFLMQRVLNDYLLTVVNFLFMNIILTVSLNITNGYTGLFSLGHPAFMTIGGYVAALMVFPSGRKSMFLPELPAWILQAQWSFFPALLLGGAVAVVVALIIGFPVLRLKGHYLAVATLGFIIIVRVVISNLEEYTRGPLGLNGLFPHTTMWWIYLWLVIAVYSAWKIKFSSFGRTLFAVRENALAAQCLGVSLTRVRITAFLLGAFFAGITGGLWAHVTTVITPKTFPILMAFNLVVMVVVGGNGSVTGSIAAAAALTVVTEVLRPVEEAVGLYGISQVIISLLLLAVLIYRPKGFFGSGEPRFLDPGRRKNLRTTVQGGIS